MAAAASKPQPVNSSRYLKNNIAMPPKMPNPIHRRGRKERKGEDLKIKGPNSLPGSRVSAACSTALLPDLWPHSGLFASIRGNLFLISAISAFSAVQSLRSLLLGRFNRCRCGRGWNLNVAARRCIGQRHGWLRCGWRGENFGNHCVALAPDHHRVAYLHQRIKLFQVLLAHAEATV